jgi:FkbM family methyltransferase
MISFFKQFIKEGDLAIDIGANIGDTTVPMALCTGVTGLTLGFDPNPFPFKILEKNASLNRDKMKLIPLPYAISTEEEEFYYVSSEASFANGAITKITEGSKHGKFVYPDKVKGINLEKFLEQEYKDWLPKFSFVKVDAEGYDKEILKSIPNLISKYKPVIIAESFASSNSKEKAELYEVIDKHGYDIFYFADFSIKAKVEKLNNSSDLIKHRETINVYAIPKK